MKRKRSLLLSSLFVLALAVVFAVSKPVQAKKVTRYLQTSSKEYRYDGGKNKKLVYKSSHKYDKNANVIAETYTSYYDSKKGKTNKYKYVYKKDQLIKSYNNNKLDTQYTYDKKGNATTIKHYKKGKLDYVETNTYKNGKIAKSVSKRGNTIISESTCYSNGKLKTMYWAFDDGARDEYNYAQSGAYTCRSYDAQGRLIAEGSYDKNGSGTWTDYSYSESGERLSNGVNVSKVTYEKGKLKRRENTYSYTPNSRVSYNTAYSTSTVTEYYTSGYREGCKKSEKYTSSEGYSWEIDYTYKADSTGKNVAVMIGKYAGSNDMAYMSKYTYKKFTVTEKQEIDLSTKSIAMNIMYFIVMLFSFVGNLFDISLSNKYSEYIEAMDSIYLQRPWMIIL